MIAGAHGAYRRLFAEENCAIKLATRKILYPAHQFGMFYAGFDVSGVSYNAASISNRALSKRHVKKLVS